MVRSSKNSIRNNAIVGSANCSAPANTTPGQPIIASIRISENSESAMQSLLGALLESCGSLGPPDLQLVDAFRRGILGMPELGFDDYNPMRTMRWKEH